MIVFTRNASGSGIKVALNALRTYSMGRLEMLSLCLVLFGAIENYLRKFLFFDKIGVAYRGLFPINLRLDIPRKMFETKTNFTLKKKLQIS